MAKSTKFSAGENYFCMYTGGKGDIGIVANIMGWQNESMVSDITVHSLIM